MKLELSLQNQQRIRAIKVRRLREIVRFLLAEQLQFTEVELSIVLVSARRMAQVNEQFLRHEGSTDVITFDYLESRHIRRSAGPQPSRLCGELLVCVEEAVTQAEVFQTSWPAEVVRYIVHGVLHLCGEDDQTPAARRIMKRRENRLVRRLEQKFSFAALARKPAARQAAGASAGGCWARKR